MSKRNIEIRPKKAESEYILTWYGHKTAAEMADDLSISINRVYSICRYYKLNTTDKRCLLTLQQHQLILGGILGDGNLKRNGSNFYYRESHSAKEREYCQWKCELFGNLVSKSGLHLVDKRDGQFGFQTKNFVTFRYYKNLTIEEVIADLSHFGVLIFILDDGWANGHALRIANGVLSRSQRELFKSQVDSLFGIDLKLCKYDMGILHQDLPKVLPYFKEYVPNTIDVYQKKIKTLYDKYMG